jgi:prolyl-tRNA editing enzyme YbaK/EbsC (Cys-tRNA(Pro) deacylase)
MSAGVREQLAVYLREQGVSFEVIEHARAESAAGEARAAQLPAEQTAKTVVLRMPAGYRFAVISGADRLDLHKAADALEAHRHELRLATEAEIEAEFPDYQVGTIPPLGPRMPAELIDPRLLEYEHVLCPAGDHEHSLVLDPLELVRVTGARTVELRQH